MNETIEDQLRRVLARAAMSEVPDNTEIPPLRPHDELAVRRSRRHWLAPLISGVAAAVIAVVATLVVVHRSDSPPIAAAPIVAVIGHVAVPDLANLSPAQADARLAALHLVLKTVDVESVGAAKDKVVGQSPVASVSVLQGTVVTVQVGTGPAFVTVPSRPVTSHPVPTTVLVSVPTDLVGLTYDQAVVKLKAADLTATQQIVDGVQPINTVVKVGGVKAGARVQAGTPVVLQVSNNQLFVVPNLANLTPDDAASQLNSAGWQGNAGNFTAYSALTTDSTVIGKIASGAQQVARPDGSGTIRKPGQAPAVGVKARKNAPFSIVVYTKKQIALPTFTAGVTTTDDVVGRLQHLGATNIKVITQQPANPPAVPHTFISMSPGSGRVVDYDAEITITVWGDSPAPSTTAATPTTPSTTAATPTTPSTPTPGTAPTTTK